MDRQTIRTTATTGTFQGIASIGAIDGARVVVALSAWSLAFVAKVDSERQQGALPSWGSLDAWFCVLAQHSCAAGALQHTSARGSAVWALRKNEANAATSRSTRGVCAQTPTPRNRVVPDESVDAFPARRLSRFAPEPG